MFEPINHYYRLEYSTHDAATAAERVFMLFVESQLGLAHCALARGNERVVLWNESVAIDNRVQFVSAGALTLLQALRAAIPLATLTPTAHLPPTRQLLVGDAKDWDHTGPY